MIKKIGLTLAIILTGLIMWPGSKANAWETIGQNQEGRWWSCEFTTRYPPASSFTASSTLYFYNKCDPHTEKILWYWFYGYQSNIGLTSISGKYSPYSYVDCGTSGNCTTAVIGSQNIEAKSSIQNGGTYWYEWQPTGYDPDYAKWFVSLTAYAGTGVEPNCNCYAISNNLDSILPPLTPPSDDYIMYYGPNPYYVITNNNNDLMLVYNICENWNENDNFYLQLMDSETEELLSTPQKIVQCSGTTRYTQKAGPVESSQPAKIIVYKNTLTLPGTRIAETDPFLYTVYIPLDSQNWINTDLNWITYVNYETTESTDVKITYRIFYDNIKNSKICMIRKDAGGLKTDLCYNEELTEGLNFFNIDIPSPEFETLQQISFGLFDGNQLIVESPTYIMSFISNASISDNIENQLTGDTSWLGLVTRNLACSDAEWESESSFLGINFTRTICSIKKFTLDLTFLGGNITKDFYNSVISGVKNIFPFGLIYNIEKSWIASKNKPLPPDISWLAPGENLDIEIPKNWTKTDENITVTVFGSNIFKNGDPNIANFFAKIRALSTYLLWAGFIWSIYGFGNKFYHQHLKKPTEVDIK